MVDLKDKIPGAPNFRYREFIRSQTATRLCIDNVPSDGQWKKIELLSTRILQPVRSRFGSIRITSGYRSPELNIAIGGSIYSNHCRGEASDIEPANVNIKLIDVVKFIYDNLEFRTVIAEYFPTGWVHVDYRAGGNIKRLKLKDKSHNYEDVNMDYLLDLYSV